MHAQERKNTYALMAFHALWGLVLWFSISKYGLGVSTDAVHQLFGGLNFAAGRGLTSYDGTFLILWPPLYPVLLGLVRSTTGMEMLDSALVIQILAFSGLSLSFVHLFNGVFRHSLALALIANVLAQAGSVVVSAFGMVGPDYLHLCLATASMVLLARYLETASPRAFVGLALLCMLSSLQRFLGVTVIVTAALAIALVGSGSFRQRLARSLVVGSTALPMLVWLGLTSPLYSRRPPITLTENLQWFTASVLEWFGGPGGNGAPPLALIAAFWLLTIGLGVLVMVWQRRISAPPPSWRTHDPADASAGNTHLSALLLYGSLYLVALFGSASIAYFNKLGGRFLLPLYVPVITLPVAAAQVLMRGWLHMPVRFRRFAKTLGYVVVIVLSLTLLPVSVRLAVESHANGSAGAENAYNNRRWRDNSALRFWQNYEPIGGYVQLSNDPDGLAFTTQRPARAAPRRMTGPYADAEIPLASYKQELFGSGLKIFLVWIEPNPYEHYYDPADLESIAILDPLFTDQQGSVFELRPRLGT